MKKILLSSLSLIILACSITLFQMSCQKEANADTADSFNVNQQNKIVYTKRVQENPREIWIANYDGSNQVKINITLPNGYDISGEVKISPDNKTLFFIADGDGCTYSLFKCNIDGSNLAKVIDGTGLGCESIRGIDAF